jgi:hypothetical protein
MSSNPAFQRCARAVAESSNDFGAPHKPGSDGAHPAVQMTPRTDTKILNWWKIPECSQPFDPNVAAISSN